MYSYHTICIVLFYKFTCQRTKNRSGIWDQYLPHHSIYRGRTRFPLCFHDCDEILRPSLSIYYGPMLLHHPAITCHHRLPSSVILYHRLSFSIIHLSASNDHTSACLEAKDPSVFFHRGQWSTPIVYPFRWIPALISLLSGAPFWCAPVWCAIVWCASCAPVWCASCAPVWCPPFDVPLFGVPPFGVPRLMYPGCWPSHLACPRLEFNELVPVWTQMLDAWQFQCDFYEGISSVNNSDEWKLLSIVAVLCLFAMGMIAMTMSDVLSDWGKLSLNQSTEHGIFLSPQCWSFTFEKGCHVIIIIIWMMTIWKKISILWLLTEIMRLLSSTWHGCTYR